MKNFIYFVIFLSFLLQSCEKQKTDQLPEDYYYYAFNFEKIPLFLLNTEILIKFNHILTREEVNQYLSKFTYFDKQTSDRIQTENIFLRCIINSKDTIHLESILKTLNIDTISFAVPVFTIQKDVSSSYTIPLDEILCVPLISDSDLRQLISSSELDISKSPPESSFYILKIKNIITGFEPLKSANSLYETGNFHYCHPNFLTKVYYWN
jgi:hypothetical protein